MVKPTFKFEKKLSLQGYGMVAGIDEVGYGCVAGPVVVSAVVLPLDSRIGMIRDSKLLSESQREEVYEEILKKCTAVSIGQASPQEIDELNIRQATFLAMRRALLKIKKLDFALVDAWTIPDLHVEQMGIVSGDKKVKSIAAASIIAKVYRDRLMKSMATKFPKYGFEQHKGYGTKMHLMAIKDFGPSPIHRVSYKIFK